MEPFAGEEICKGGLFWAHVITPGSIVIPKKTRAAILGVRGIADGLPCEIISPASRSQILVHGLSVGRVK